MKDWMAVIQVLAGAVIALGGLFIQLRWRNKELHRERLANEQEATQKWYYERYLEEGIDSLIESLSQLSDYYFNFQHSLTLPDKPPIYPTRAGERVRILMNDPHFLDILKHLYIAVDIPLKRYEYSDWEALTNDVLINFRALRSYLIDKTIKTKAEVYEIHKDKDVADQSKRLNALTDTICRLGSTALTVSHTIQYIKDKPMPNVSTQPSAIKE
jgi:hypothetical protein